MLSRKKVKMFKNQPRWPLTVPAGADVSRHTGPKQPSKKTSPRQLTIHGQFNKYLDINNFVIL